MRGRLFRRCRRLTLVIITLTDPLKKVWKLVMTAKHRMVWKQNNYNKDSLAAAWCQKGLHSSFFDLSLPLHLHLSPSFGHARTCPGWREGNPLHMVGKCCTSWITGLTRTHKRHNTLDLGYWSYKVLNVIISSAVLSGMYPAFSWADGGKPRLIRTKQWPD